MAEVMGLEVDSSVLADWGVLELLYDMTQGDATKAVPLARAIYGDCYDDAKRMVSCMDGGLTAQNMFAFITATLDEIAKQNRGELKN